MRELTRGSVGDLWSCRSIAHDSRLLEGRAQQGEVNFLRGMLERQGTPLETSGTVDKPKP